MIRARLSALFGLTLAGLSLTLGACAPASGPDVRGSLTRAVIDRSPQPLILAEGTERGLGATLIPAGRNGDVVTWRTGQNQMLSFDGGVLVATRGLGADLMSADVAATRAALTGGPNKGYARLMSYLDGDDNTLLRAMVCDMAPGTAATVDSFGLSFPTTLRVETCRTTGFTTRNRYWLNPDGTMRRAEQWVGPGAGTLVTEWLTR